MKRRQFLTSTSAAILTAGVLSQTLVERAFAQGQAPQTRLAMPTLLDTRATRQLVLTATSRSSAFAGGPGVPTAGFNQAYLGPTILVQNGELAARLILEPLTEHIHVHIKITGSLSDCHAPVPHQLHRLEFKLPAEYPSSHSPPPVPS